MPSWQVPTGWVSSCGDDLELRAEVDYRHARQVAGDALAGGWLGLGDIRLLSEDLLPGWHEEWALADQDSFRMLRVQALEAACRTMTEEGQHGLATQAGMAALSGAPLSESAAEALIHAYVRQGNRYAAANLFRSFCDQLRRELRVEPAASLVARVRALGMQL